MHMHEHMPIHVHVYIQIHKQVHVLLHVHVPEHVNVHVHLCMSTCAACTVHVLANIWTPKHHEIRLNQAILPIVQLSNMLFQLYVTPGKKRRSNRIFESRESKFPFKHFSLDSVEGSSLVLEQKSPTIWWTALQSNSLKPVVRLSVCLSVRLSVRPSARFTYGPEGPFSPPQELERSPRRRTELSSVIYLASHCKTMHWKTWSDI